MPMGSDNGESGGVNAEVCKRYISFSLTSRLVDQNKPAIGKKVTAIRLNALEIVNSLDNRGCVQ
jgi:hypothetical protein